MDGPPAPPVELPPGRIVPVDGHGELFVRDSGGDGTPVMLLHGWTVSADLNWFRAYAALQEAGYRVVALDHRGHGRGTRGPDPFRLADCAGDAAALLDTLGTGPVLVVGYSMGGPIGQLLTRARPDLVAGLVVCATAAQWTSPRQKLLWRSLVAIRLLIALVPDRLWPRVMGGGDSPTARWTAAELQRGNAIDLAEAGRELSRYDARSWVAGLHVPAASVVTTLDTGVPPAHQRALAALLRAPVFEVAGDHLAVTNAPDAFNPALLRALDAVSTAGAARAAA